MAFAMGFASITSAYQTVWPSSSSADAQPVIAGAARTAHSIAAESSFFLLVMVLPFDGCAWGFGTRVERAADGLDEQPEGSGGHVGDVGFGDLADLRVGGVG